MSQFDIDQQIRRSKLIEYVSGFGSTSERDAEQWLDANCPQWRSGVEPKAHKIEIESDDDE